MAIRNTNVDITYQYHRSATVLCLLWRLRHHRDRSILKNTSAVQASLSFWWHFFEGNSDGTWQVTFLILGPPKHRLCFHCTSSTITVAVSAQLPIHAVSCVHQFRDMNYSLELQLSATNWAQVAIITLFNHAEFMRVALAECWGCEALKQVICGDMEQERSGHLGELHAFPSAACSSFSHHFSR